MDWVLKILTLLVPPNTNDLGPQQRWRWVVFATLMALIVTQAVTFAVERGYTPYPKFAFDTTVQQVQTRVDITAQIVLERDMKDKLKDFCTTKDPGYRQELSDDIERLQKEYRKITGDWYKLRGCNEP